MALFLLKRDESALARNPSIDGIEAAVVDAASEAAAITAALALDTRLPADYWVTGDGTNIATGYDGGLFGKVVLDAGVGT